MTHIEHVQRTYADSEVLEFGKQQARCVYEIGQLELQKKAAMEHFKGAISAEEEKIGLLSENINRGYEIIPTPCDIVLNQPTKGMKSYVCQKTMATIKVVAMNDQDKQNGLFDSQD